jgi:hypothetical protein
MFEHKAFRFTQAEPSFYCSSRLRERSLCPNCGSPLIMWNADKASQNHVGILIGTLDHPELYPPEKYAGSHSGIESQVPWLRIEAGLPR